MDAKKKEIYDEIATVYSDLFIPTKIDVAAVTNQMLWAEVGNVMGKSVLDLACGTGYFTRKFKEKGASKVVGVDISPSMIEEGRKIEAEQPIGVTYFVGDGADFDAGEEFDLVTAQYLLCYAQSKAVLRRMCETLYRNTKPGGRLVTITGTLDDDEDCKYASKTTSIFYPDNKELIKNTYTLQDGFKVMVQIISNDGESKCCFPNYLWRRDTIIGLMQQCGFSEVQWQSLPLSGAPKSHYKMFTAVKLSS